MAKHSVALAAMPERLQSGSKQQQQGFLPTHVSGLVCVTPSWERLAPPFQGGIQQQEPENPVPSCNGLHAAQHQDQSAISAQQTSDGVTALTRRCGVVEKRLVGAVARGP
jgi:hypothetical protein